MHKLSLSETHKLRFMQTREAEEFLDSLGITGDALEELRPMIGRSIPVGTYPNLDISAPIAQEATTKRTSNQHNLPRRLLITTLWLLGGSNNKIAKLLGVTNQTVFIHVDKTLPSGNARHKLRVNYAISAEAIEWYMQQWLTHSDELGTMNDAREMAVWLATHHPYQE